MLRYLVDPIFQVINTAGKPATGGYIEVYLHGTRDKYYCASDFNGTLHPFKIPLDSLGANIILADDANAYDIYVYNRYGSLLMSRYNVATVQGGGSGGGDHIGKVHFLKAVYDDLADVRAPYGFWIVDLEKPNPQSPYGYDYAMAEEVIAQLSAGEIFALSTYPTAPSAEEDLFIMCSSQNQSREGRQAVRIWFTRMFASNSPEYMYFTTIYTPSRSNSDPPDENSYPEGRMAILNWRGQQDVLSEFHFMPYTELSEVATTGDYNDLNNKPTIPAAQVQSDWSQSDNTQVDYIKNKPNLALKENVSNKVQTINDTSTTDYPSSKAVADFVNGIYTVINEKIQRGLNTTQTNSQAYSLVGTLNVTDSNKRGMMGFELFCCKQCAKPIRMHATFGYQNDNNLTASYSIESSVNSELARYKLAWRFANDHTANSPKIEIWLIDTIDTGADTRRCGCVVHMVSGIEWIDGNQTTNTLPSGLTDFTQFYPRGETVNVNTSDSNTDTSSFEFVNGHIYHLTVDIVYTELHIGTTSSGIGYIVAYIGSSAINSHYSSSQEVYVQNGAIQTYDIRLHVDWKAENIAGSSDNKLHIKVMFGNTAYTFVQSNYSLVLVGTDFG